MRWMVVATLVLGCAADRTAQIERRADTWYLTCTQPMDECVRHALSLCPQQRFRIIDGKSSARVRGIPPYEQATLTTSISLICTHDGADSLFSKEEEDDARTKQAEAQPNPNTLGGCEMSSSPPAVGASQTKPVPGDASPTDASAKPQDLTPP